MNHLSLHFMDDHSLPNFAEAISKYRNLQTLHLANVSVPKLNYAEFLKAMMNFQNLRVLALEEVNLSDE